MAKLEEALQMKTFENEYQKLYLNILLTAQILESNIAKALKEYDLTVAQFNVLRILRGQKGQAISAIDIQKRMIHKTSNISRIIDKLEEKELAERVDCEENRRIRHVFISKKGLKLLEDCQYIIDQMNETIAEKVTERKVDITAFNLLLDLLRTIE